VTQRTDSGKRQALLDAALQLFLANGVLETTVDDVLQLSGASVGSLYHHFGGKEQLADALYVDCLSAYHRVALERLGAADDAEAGVRSLIEHHLDWITAHRAQSQFLLSYREHEIRPAAANLRALNTNFYTELEHWITTRAARAVALLPAVISQWIGPMHMYARHWLTATIRATPDDVRQFLSDGAWQSMQSIFSPATSTTASKG
jgi:AcrR family transcriptional regulator